MQVIENQYSPKDDYSLYSQLINFTQPEASLSYNMEPTTGWLVRQNDLLQKVRYVTILTISANLYTCIKDATRDH